MKRYSQPWLSSRTTDTVFILLPAVLPLFVITIFPGYFKSQTTVNSIWWVVLVLVIDVGHVYSTFFRFYWNPTTFQSFKLHILIIPLVGLIGGIILYSQSSLMFWRVLAYLAVFHFIRQQYGFLRIYSRNDIPSKLRRLIDNAAIYSATIYPLFYWHIYRTNEINWFIKDDFFSFSPTLGPYAKTLYIGIIILYIAKEGIFFIRERHFNFPKNAIVFGTYISWYFGIVYYKGDLIFTMMNVVAHGIPYIALVYLYEHKANARLISIPWKKIGIFITTIAALAYFEEGLWDILIWRDHEELFPIFSSLPSIDNQIALAVVIPLLTLPQFTHYVLDGFIWKLKNR